MRTYAVHHRYLMPTPQNGKGWQDEETVYLASEVDALLRRLRAESDCKCTSGALQPDDACMLHGNQYAERKVTHIKRVAGIDYPRSFTADKRSIVLRALEGAATALEFSLPKMARYPEPNVRHAIALSDVRAAIKELTK